ncbi:MAG: signal peptidase II [Bacteroidia bacterium]|nr:signal peptidase II [Bacteroidia bacterium]
MIAAAILLVDQATKIAVKLTMRPDETIRIVGDVVKLHFIENPGAAFGMTLSRLTGGMDEESGKLILTIFSIFAVAAIAVYLTRVADHKTGLPFWVAVVLGGATGNIVDRVFYGLWFDAINDYDGGLFHGRVVDMIYIDIWNGVLPETWPVIGGQYWFIWPIFNVADIAITVGIGAIFIFQKRFFPVKPAAKPVHVSRNSSDI